MNEDLHWLAESGQTDRLRSAVEEGEDTESRDAEGRTALHVAVAAGSVPSVRALLDAGADVEAAEEALPRYRAIHRACVASDAAEAERIEILDTLVDHGADLKAADGRGQTALHLVISWCTAELLERLLARGADATAADAAGRTPLHVASTRGGQGLDDWLLGDDGELAAPRRLHRADSALARLDDESILRQLVQAGADVNAADRTGMTSLHVAAERGDVRAVETLIELGASVTARDTYDATPLHRAATGDVAEKLLDAGAPIDPADRDGRTPLHRAIGGGRMEVADRLLAAGALAGIADREGRTPLHVAAAAGRAHAVERLLTAGADPVAADSEGRTPLQLARAGGHSMVVSTLKRRGRGGRRGFPFF